MQKIIGAQHNLEFLYIMHVSDLCNNYNATECPL